ncbi:CRIB domain, Rho GTPase activation protein [Artemisia annua]|uniref:CRIB domain, Rho GTPase activation protein n=1 Tax=Artemisia annua TaxID=35608 RepID=A0A2U1PZ12_ARTAN|nr:CRIB domain, Rho GTPase activation protein [Artemisia annua]
MTKLFRSKSCGITPPPQQTTTFFQHNNDTYNEEDIDLYYQDYNTPFITPDRRHDDNDPQSPSFTVVALFLAALRKSIVTCTVDDDSEDDDHGSCTSSLDIGCPTDVQHVSHVTFDRFDGFLGLPTELQSHVSCNPPSASIRVFGVSAESMQCSYDDRGNSVPTILLMMQKRLYEGGGLQAEGIFRINAENSQEEDVRKQLNRGFVPSGIDVHCLAGLIKAWFRELPRGILDSLTAEQVMHCNTEEDCSRLVKSLPQTEAALLDWAINLMADVVKYEPQNKMNARNIAMVFAPNMTQMADPLTALIHAVQVMNFLKTLVIKTLCGRDESYPDVQVTSSPPDNTELERPESLIRLTSEKDEKFWSFPRKSGSVVGCDNVSEKSSPANHELKQDDEKETVAAEGILESIRVFGVSAESMQCSYDDRGNSVPTILLMMQKRLYEGGGLQAEGIFRINAENSQEEDVRKQLNRGFVPSGIDVHCLAGLIKAWFRELPRGILDSLTAEQSPSFTVVALFLAALRKSIVTCTVDDDSEDDDHGSCTSSLDIGCPTDVQHVSHVTFDRFDGFLGLPTELQSHVSCNPPSASIRVFGVSAESMQCSYDDRGNSVPTILLMMQKRLYEGGGLQAEGIFRINAENSQEEDVRKQLNRGFVPSGIDVHCLAGLIKAWFRELPRGILDSLTAEQVMHCNTEEDCSRLVKSLPQTEAALLDWAINLMADVVKYEPQNKMNARNIAMVFAPNMTQMADPLTALIHAVQVMNFLKTLVIKTLRGREESYPDVQVTSSPPDNTELERPGSLIRLASEKDEKFWSFPRKSGSVVGCDNVSEKSSPANHELKQDDEKETVAAEGILERLSLRKGQE